MFCLRNWALCILAVAPAWASDPPKPPPEKPAVKAEPKLVRYRRISSYTPKAGDQVYLLTGSSKTHVVNVCVNSYTMDEMIKYMSASDDIGYKKMLAAKRVALIPELTLVRVLEVHENEFLFKGNQVAEVRMLEGEYKDQTGWVLGAFLGLIEILPEPAPVPPRTSRPRAEPPNKGKPIEIKVGSGAPAQRKPGQPTKHSGSARFLLDKARELDKAGKTGNATDTYEMVIRQYGDTFEAAEAEKELKTRGTRKSKTD